MPGVPMINCSYNSLWQGQIIQPEWDMFQSDHLCAEFHAGSRTICGGPVYVSDRVGHHIIFISSGSWCYLMEPYSSVGIMPFPPEIASLRTHSLTARPCSNSSVRIKVSGSGTFLAYSSEKHKEADEGFEQ
ncbi:Stachyose synthase [Morella rubra]|uniref:Stachyose synthase n=1 Tax=Morella rubra TaxID=262757 RepID=A0A6A1VPG2_9ROSI|nr:Stachyose synthase [Morella rubra]